MVLTASLRLIAQKQLRGLDVVRPVARFFVVAIYRGWSDRQVRSLLKRPAPVQQIVGHRAIDVTMTIYAHACLDEMRQALENLGRHQA